MNVFSPLNLQITAGLLKRSIRTTRCASVRETSMPQTFDCLQEWSQLALLKDLAVSIAHVDIAFIDAVRNLHLQCRF